MKSITDRKLWVSNDTAVTSMHEYIFISGVLMLLMVITILTLTAGVIDPPTNHLTEYAFIDIGNGVSTRMVDLYVIAPNLGNITTTFDIPDEVIGRQYYVTVGTTPTGDQVSVFREQIRRNVSLGGIGVTMGIGGATTGEGLNKISYKSGGFE